MKRGRKTRACLIFSDLCRRKWAVIAVSFHPNGYGGKFTVYLRRDAPPAVQEVFRAASRVVGTYGPEIDHATHTPHSVSAYVGLTWRLFGYASIGVKFVGPPWHELMDMRLMEWNGR